jgi:hypothetical protein
VTQRHTDSSLVASKMASIKRHQKFDVSGLNIVRD